jgi:predicted MarR family transcription regulator
MAQALGVPAERYSTGQMTYDLRRLRLHGLIERLPHTHRYRVTAFGLRIALFFTKVHARILRPGISQLFDGCPKSRNRPVATAMRKLDQALETLLHQAKLAPSEI